jgi:hypothetical protein
MYYIKAYAPNAKHGPDGDKPIAELQVEKWHEVVPWFVKQGVQESEYLMLDPPHIAAEVARNGGSPWQDNEFDGRVDGEWVGITLVVEGEEEDYDYNTKE